MWAARSRNDSLSAGGRRLVLLVRDPTSLYVYWPMSDPDPAPAQQMAERRWILRLYDITDVELRGRPALSSIDYGCAAGARSGYLTEVIAGRRYRAVLGYRDAGGRWSAVAASNAVQTPANRQSDWFDDHYVTLSPTRHLTTFSVPAALRRSRPEDQCETTAVWAASEESTIPAPSAAVDDSRPVGLVRLPRGVPEGGSNSETRTPEAAHTTGPSPDRVGERELDRRDRHPQPSTERTREQRAAVVPTIAKVVAHRRDDPSADRAELPDQAASRDDQPSVQAGLDAMRRGSQGDAPSSDRAAADVAAIDDKQGEQQATDLWLLADPPQPSANSSGRCSSALVNRKGIER